MSSTPLWPPLDLVRKDLDPDCVPSSQGVAASALPEAGWGSPEEQTAHAEYLLLPLTELARRRAAVQSQGFAAHWAAGRLICVSQDHVVYGVLLGHQVGPHRWQGWMAASECDWAGSFDVLLEPGDDPFEPMFGLVQAWNTVTLTSGTITAQVVGELSAVRLAAIRAVADEHAAGGGPSLVSAAPGRIALRWVAGGSFSVLTGTPLGPGDVREAYQALYRAAAARLMAASAPAQLQAPAAFATLPPERTGWLSSLGGWFAADWAVRPAFALLVLMVLVQNLGSLGLGGEDADDVVRFRTADPALAHSDLSVRWKASASMDGVQQLLQSASSQIVAGPRADGSYVLKSDNPVAASKILGASPLVAHVVVP